MIISFLLLCVVLILIYIYIFYINSYTNYWSRRNIVQFKGVLRNFITGNRCLAELYKHIYDCYPEEKYVGLYLGTKYALMLKDVDDINFVLQGDFHNFFNRGFVTNPNDILAGNLLFINDYNRWRLLRQKLSPVFTHKKLKNMFYIMDRCGRDFVQFVEDNPQIRSKPFNALYTFTTASTGASVFGIDTKTKNTMDSPFIDMSWKVFEPSLFDTFKTTLSNFYPSLFLTLNLSIFQEHEKFFVGVIKRVLESRRETKESRYDFIDICLELQQSGKLCDTTTGYELAPTDEVLAAQAFFFFIAGTDPCASAMNYALLELSYNPIILQRVHEEIDNVFSECKGSLTYEDVLKLVHLDMVINESLRKYPPVSVIQRACMKDTVLPSGLRVEENTILVIPIFAVHRDEKYYPEPDLYKPERFAPNNVSNFAKNAYLPFGGGNRICIGLRFARLQMKVGLAMLLRRFTLREQSHRTSQFAHSFFFLRDKNATYELIKRN